MRSLCSVLGSSRRQLTLTLHGKLQGCPVVLVFRSSHLYQTCYSKGELCQLHVQASAPVISSVHQTCSAVTVAMGLTALIDSHVLLVNTPPPLLSLSSLSLGHATLIQHII